MEQGIILIDICAVSRKVQDSKQGIFLSRQNQRKKSVKKLSPPPPLRHYPHTPLADEFH